MYLLLLLLGWRRHYHDLLRPVDRHLPIQNLPDQPQLALVSVRLHAVFHDAGLALATRLLQRRRPAKRLVHHIHRPRPKLCHRHLPSAVLHGGDRDREAGPGGHHVRAAGHRRKRRRYVHTPSATRSPLHYTTLYYCYYYSINYLRLTFTTSLLCIMYVDKYLHAITLIYL